MPAIILLLASVYLLAVYALLGLVKRTHTVAPNASEKVKKESKIHYLSES